MHTWKLIRVKMMTMFKIPDDSIWIGIIGSMWQVLINGLNIEHHFILLMSTHTRSVSCVEWAKSMLPAPMIINATEITNTRNPKPNNSFVFGLMFILKMWFTSNWFICLWISKGTYAKRGTTGRALQQGHNRFSCAMLVPLESSMRYVTLNIVIGSNRAFDF